MPNVFTYTIEKDEEGYFIGEVLDLPGCHTQAKSLDELETRVKEAILLYLKGKKDFRLENRFVGVQQVEVSVS